MRWTSRIVAALVVALALFAISPFVAIHNLAKAVERRDVAALQERVSFRAVAASLSRQLVATYLDTREPDRGGASRDLALGAGMALADPVVQQLVTPDLLVQVLARGWPERAVEEPAPPGVQGLRAASWTDLLDLVRTAETHGFRRVLVSYPPGEPRPRQFRLHFGLKGLTLRGFAWNLVAVDLPDELRQRLAAEIRRRAEHGALLRPSLSDAR